MKSVDLAHLRNVVLAGHTDCRQDHARRASAPRLRRRHPPRQGRRRDGRPRLRARGAEAQALAVAGGRDASSTMAIASRWSTRPATPTSSARSSRASRRPTPPSSAWMPRAASRRGPRPPSRSVARLRTAALFVLTRCERENADPMRRARRAARRVRHQDRAAPPGDRRGRPLPRLRRPASTARPIVSEGRQRRRSPSRPSSRARSPVAATSSSRPPPRPTTTS